MASLSPKLSRTLALASALTLAVSGMAFAQQATPMQAAPAPAQAAPAPQASTGSSMEKASRGQQEEVTTHKHHASKIRTEEEGRNPGFPRPAKAQ